MQRKIVALNQSALFRVRSFKRLSTLMQRPIEEIENIASSNANYMEYSNKSGRWIEAPKPKIKEIQKRFARLLSQIETPSYLHSSVRKRSYVSNASGHTTIDPTAKIDLKKFYNSARAAQVYQFLTVRLEWSGDVAGLMTRILVHNGHLPTGGSASPLLSFWVYRDLFDAVDQLAKEVGAIFSLYVDDMTLTGSLVRRATIHDVRRLVGQSRLKAHKTKFFPAGTSKVITGVVQTPRGTRVPFERQARIREAIQTLRNAESVDERFEALKPLVGRLCEAAEIDPGTWLARRDKAIAAKMALERVRSAGDGKVAVELPAVEAMQLEPPSDTVPWH